MKSMAMSYALVGSSLRLLIQVAMFWFVVVSAKLSN